MLQSRPAPSHLARISRETVKNDNRTLVPESKSSVAYQRSPGTKVIDIAAKSFTPSQSSRSMKQSARQYSRSSINAAAIVVSSCHITFSARRLPFHPPIFFSATDCRRVARGSAEKQAVYRCAPDCCAPACKRLPRQLQPLRLRTARLLAGFRSSAPSAAATSSPRSLAQATCRAKCPPACPSVEPLPDRPNSRSLVPSPSRTQPHTRTYITLTVDPRRAVRTPLSTD